MEREDPGVAREVRIGGEKAPAAGCGDGAKENVHEGDSEAIRAAVIAAFCGQFVVFGRDGLVEIRAQRGAEGFELGRRTNAGKKFLPDEADYAGAAFADEFI